MNICKYCTKQIHWIKLNGESKPFDDPYGSTLHQCNQYQQQRKTLKEKISELQEQIQKNHNLIVKLIPRIADLEKRFES